jgi:hypothetical protein
LIITSAAAAIATRTGIGVGCRRRLGFAAEQAFQPSDETAGFLLRLGARSRLAVGLVRAGLELAIVPARLPRLEGARPGLVAGIARLALVARIAGLTRLAGLEGTAALARITPVAGRLKGRTVFAARSGRLGGGRAG